MSRRLSSLALPQFLAHQRGADKRTTTSAPISTREESVRVYRDDLVLVRACCEGDEDAWKELVDKYGRLVFSVALRDGLTQADAEDIFQTVFTIALRQLPTLRNETCLSSWLATIAHWQSLRLTRRSCPVSEIDESIEDSGTSVPDQVRRLEREEMVRQAIDRLDPRSRELVYHLFLEPEASYTELARRLGLPLGSIGPTRARCLKKLKKILTEMHIDLDF